MTMELPIQSNLELEYMVSEHSVLGRVEFLFPVCIQSATPFRHRVHQQEAASALWNICPMPILLSWGISKIRRHPRERKLRRNHAVA